MHLQCPDAIITDKNSGDNWLKIWHEHNYQNTINKWTDPI